MEALVEADDHETDEPEIGGRPFARRLDRLIRDSELLIQQIPSERFSPSHSSGMAPVTDQRRQKDVEAALSPLVSAAARYSDEANAWFLRQSGALLERERKLNELIDMGREEEARASGMRIVDAVEAIRWDQWLIPAKIYRAQTGAALDNALDSVSRDASGSAKVALLSLDRSIEAWSHVRDEIPSAEDSILPLQVQLSRIRASIEAAFPTARLFERPGFDV
jgi:hypothetical protein